MQIYFHYIYIGFLYFFVSISFHGCLSTIDNLMESSAVAAEVEKSHCLGFLLAFIREFSLILQVLTAYLGHYARWPRRHCIRLANLWTRLLCFKDFGQTRALMGALVNLWAWPAVKDKDKPDYVYFIVSTAWASAKYVTHCHIPPQLSHRSLHVASLHDFMAFAPRSHIYYTNYTFYCMWFQFFLAFLFFFFFARHVAKGSLFHCELMLYLYDVLSSI